jgi:dephospho-CoA kinase
MKLFGLTGGIGMGKSTSGSLLRDRGVPVVDTDALARELVEPGRPALEEIRQEFGPGITGADGRLRRDELGRRVFADPAARARLEAILHPGIRRLWQERVAAWRGEGRPFGVVVIPLLYETDAVGLFDAVICAACSRPTQLQRLEARGWAPDHIQGRLAAQWPAEKKMDLANFVVWTEGSLENHAQQLERISHWNSHATHR